MATSVRAPRHTRHHTEWTSPTHTDTDTHTRIQTSGCVARPSPLLSSHPVEISWSEEGREAFARRQPSVSHPLHTHTHTHTQREREREINIQTCTRTNTPTVWHILVCVSTSYLSDWLQLRRVEEPLGEVVEHPVALADIDTQGMVQVVGATHLNTHIHRHMPLIYQPLSLSSGPPRV